MTDKLDMASPDLVSRNIEEIAALFPNCVTETAEGKRIDFELLKQELSRDIIEGNKERYRLEWPGKREAIVTANLPTTKTLRPIREDSVDFDNTENLYIEGDNLEVLKLLQESYLGKIKMIYIDPPYNTGKDFVYKDNFTQGITEFKEESGQVDEYNQRLVANPESAGRYHSDWLTMMYPRLKLARNLLTDDGVIYCSIDDNESHNLRKIMDEIFGEGNFIASIAAQVNPRGRHLDNFIAKTHETILIFGKDVYVRSTMFGLEKSGNMVEEYNKSDEKGAYRLLGLRNRNQAFNPITRRNLYYPIYVNPTTKKVSIQKDSEFSDEALPMTAEGVKTCWTWGKEKVVNENGLLIADQVNGAWQIFRKDYLFNDDGIAAQTLPKSLWLDKEINNDYGKASIKDLFDKNIMDFPKSPELIKKIILSGATKNSIILDFFSGSSTTAHAVIDLNAEDNGNRKFIMVQLPAGIDESHEAFKAGFNKISELGRERIRRAGKRIIEKIKEEASKKVQPLLISDNSSKKSSESLDVGFRVYRIADSNMLDVYYRPQDYKQDALELFADNVKEDRTSDDLLAQVMLDWGLPLSLKMEQLKISDKQVFKVAGNSLMACFDKGVDEDFAKEAASHTPLRIVFRDSSFKNDTAKENVRQLLKQLSPETEMRVI